MLGPALTLRQWWISIFSATPLSLNWPRLVPDTLLAAMAAASPLMASCQLSLLHSTWGAWGSRCVGSRGGYGCMSGADRTESDRDCTAPGDVGGFGPYRTAPEQVRPVPASV